MTKMMRPLCHICYYWSIGNKAGAFLQGVNMTYGQIFSEIWLKNKRYILFCITLCIAFSVLFYGNLTSLNAYDADGAELAASIGGSFGEALGPILSMGLFGGIDISWVMVIMSTSALGANFGRGSGIWGLDRLSGFSFGIFDNIYICIFLLVWFGLPIILKAFSKTNAVGCSIEAAEKKVNGVMMVIVVMAEMIMNTGPKCVVRAASGVGRAISYGVSAIVCLVVLLVTLLIYFLVRYLFSLVDIVMVPVCTLVPFVSFFWVLAKLAFIGFMILLAVYMPGAYVFLSLLLIILSAFLFRTAYLAVRYFEAVYVKALFKRVFGGFDKNKPLVAPRLPAKVREFLQGKNIQMVIPAYVLREFPNLKGMRKWDKFWMVVENGSVYLLKPLFGKKGCWQIALGGTPAQKMFINSALPYYEIFHIYGSEEAIAKTFKRIPKMFHMVFSKEYYYRFEEIKQLTGFVDYAAYKEYLKNYFARPQMPV